MGRTLVGWSEGALDRLLCVLGAVMFSQIPEFMQQYLQRLGGHLDEARRQLGNFARTAAQSGLSLDQLIHQTSANADPAVAKLGAVMSESATRVETLESARTALLNAHVWSRPFVFLEHVDRQIASGTWQDFKPAVPTTIEGLVYALLGMLALLSVYHFGVRYPLSRVIRQRRRIVHA
jgi:hypothetical protein